MRGKITISKVREIKDLRENKRLDLKEISKVVGLGLSTVSAIVRADYDPVKYNEITKKKAKNESLGYSVTRKKMNLKYALSAQEATQRLSILASQFASLDMRIKEVEASQVEQQNISIKTLSILSRVFDCVKKISK